MNVVLYCRASSVRSREAKFIAMETSLDPDATVVGRFHDWQKGDGTGPGLAQALKALRQGEAQALVVLGLDRLGRDKARVDLINSLAKDEGWRLIITAPQQKEEPQ